MTIRKVVGIAPIDQGLPGISKDEVRAALKKLKSGKAVGPDDRVEYLTGLFNNILVSEEMHEEWDILECTHSDFQEE